MKNLNCRHAKRLYLENNSISIIATILNISRTAVYAYKNSDAKKNIDWDELRFLKATDNADAKKSEQEFIRLLIHSFETALDKLNQSEPDQQIATIAKYVNTYYKLKSQKGNVKVNKVTLAKAVLEKVSKIAIATNNQCAIDFLAANAEHIVSDIANVE